MGVGGRRKRRMFKVCGYIWVYQEARLDRVFDG